MLRSLLSVVLILCMAAPVYANKRTDRIQFTLSGDWDLANSAGTSKYQIMEFVRKGDTLKSWKELVTVQNLAKTRRFRSPEDTLKDLKALREKECPASTEWNVIEQDKNSILYEWHAKTCLGQPEQVELARIIYGKYNVFVVHYATRVHELSEETRVTWTDWLRSVTVSY
jgi:hypothetical protein